LGPRGDKALEPYPTEVEVSDPLGRVWTIQRLVYYISEVLHDTKTRYLGGHKLLYAVLIASKKLCHYFQAHQILVVTLHPLRAILHNPNTTGNIANWVAELVEFGLDFIAHHAIKTQVLTDFIAEWTPPTNQPVGPDDSASEPQALMFSGVHWTPFFDGSSRKRGVSAGALLALRTGSSSSTWCILSSKRPTTW
jgi:hypothetical protein